MVDNDKLVIKPKKYKGNDGYKTFSIRIKEELVEDIDSVSIKTERSRNELIGIFLEYAVNHCKIEEQELQLLVVMTLHQQGFISSLHFVFFLFANGIFVISI